MQVRDSYKWVAGLQAFTFCNFMSLRTPAASKYFYARYFAGSIK
ncbi:MAG: hypothetical protein ACJA0J_002340, partial [Bdellovibrionota bacterium]